jgi:hypothetical protein
VNGRERVEGVVEGHEIVGGLLERQQRLVERHPGRSAAPLLVAVCAREVHQYSSHHARGHREEVRAILPPDLLQMRIDAM